MSVADVVVVGAGPAGAAAAGQLAAAGLRVMLVDRAAFPRDKPCGDYCNPGASGLLAAMGLLPQVLRGGAGVIEAMTVVAQDGSGFTERYPSGYGLLMRRARLDLLLLQRAAQFGAEIVEGYHVDTVTIDDLVTVRDAARHRGAIRGRLLIAADGMRSVIAQRLGRSSGASCGRFTVGAYFSGVPGPPAGELHLGPGLYGGVARFGDGSANACLALPRHLLARRSAPDAFAAGVQALPALAQALRGWRREGDFRVTGPVGYAAHPAYADRTLLAGDAAGQVEPMTGQGISFALRSGLLAAEEAAHALAAGELSARSLRNYARRRSRALGPGLRVMHILTSLALRPSLTPMLVQRLIHTPGLARRLLGATGDVLPADAVLSPRFVLRFLLGIDAHAA